MAESLALRRERGRRDLSHHEPGVEARILDEKGRQRGEGGIGELLDAAFADGAEFSQAHREQVGADGHRLSVKITPGKDLAILGKDERVVGHRVHLHLDPGHDAVEDIAHRTVHLWRATYAVGVLNPDVVVAVRFPDLGALHERPQVPGAALLAGVGTQGVDARVESRVGTPQGVGGHRADQVRCAHQAASLQGGGGEQRGHGLGAVDEREPLLRLQNEGLPADCGETLQGRHPFTPDHELAASDEWQGEVSEGSEIAARAHRATAGNPRQRIGIEKGEERVDHFGANPRVPAGQSIGTEQEHAAHRLRVERLPDSRGMAEDQTLLK